MKITTKQYPRLITLMQSAYPEYKGRRFFIEARVDPFYVFSYWFEGSRDYYIFVRADGSKMGLPQSPPWTQHQGENRTAQLVPGLACVRHTICCGNDRGLTLILHPNDLPKGIT
jgi:hypothetical protein